jgi:hypothetical protein
LGWNILSDFLSVEKILRKVESDLNTLRWGHQRGKLFLEAGKLFEEKGDFQKVKEMSWENQLFCLMYLGPSQQKTSLKRFAPLVEYTSGVVFPDVESFSEEQIDYYKRRADETKNPIHKARYSDIIWELKKNHIFARKAIDAYLQCVPVFYDNDWQIEMADSLGRAAQIALSLNDKNEVNKVKEELFRWIKILADNVKYRFCLELIDAILEMKKFVDHEELKIIVEIASSGTRFYQEIKDGYHLQRSFLEELVKLMLILKDPEKALEYRKEIAESFVKEGDWKLKNYPSGNLVAAFFYEEAAKSYTDLGFTEKVNELKKKIKIQTREAVETEFKEIRTTVTVPKKPIIDYIKKLTSLTLREALTKIVNEPFFVPNLSRIKLEVEEQKKKSPLSFIIPQVSIRDDNPVLKSQTEEELFEEHIVQRVAIDYKIKNGIFGDIIAELRNEKNLDHISLLNFLSFSSVYEKDSLDMIGTGLERYFSEDFPSALHLLMPQLERTLRNILERLGVATTILRGNVIEEKTLGRILKEPKLEEFLGEDISCYLRTFLIDKRGDNLRNDIAHGLITKEKCTRNMANTLLFIFLLLTKFGQANK